MRGRRRCGAREIVISGAVALATWLAPVTPASAASTPTTCGSVRVATPIEVDGALGDPDSFVQRFRVTATKKAAPEFELNQDLLTTAKGTVRRIAHARVEVTNPKALGRLKTGTATVAVKGVRFAGVYEGRLRLRGTGCRFPLVVRASAAPELGLVGSGSDRKIQLDLTRCNGTCGPGAVSKLFVPSRRRPTQIKVVVENTAQGRATVLDVRTALRGDPGETPVPYGAVRAQPGTGVLADRATAELEPIDLDIDTLEPGHYTGAVYLTVAENEKRTALPMEVDVKDGPFIAVILLLITVIVQVLLWLVARNQPRRGAIEKVHGLRDALKGQIHEDDLKLLGDRIDGARDTAAGGDIETAVAALDGIATDAARLQQARELEQKAGEIGKAEDVEERLRVLREAIKTDDGQANSHLTDLRVAVRRLAAAEDAPMAALAELDEADADPIPPPPTPRATASRWERLRRAGGNATKELRFQAVQFTLHPLPWFLRGVLLAVLVFAGLHEVYFNDSTFGDDWLVDYGSVVLIGFTALAVTGLVSKILPAAPAEPS